MDLSDTAAFRLPGFLRKQIALRDEEQHRDHERADDDGIESLPGAARDRFGRRHVLGSDDALRRHLVHPRQDQHQRKSGDDDEHDDAQRERRDVEDRQHLRRDLHDEPARDGVRRARPVDIAASEFPEERPHLRPLTCPPQADAGANRGDHRLSARQSVFGASEASERLIAHAVGICNYGRPQRTRGSQREVIRALLCARHDGVVGLSRRALLQRVCVDGERGVRRDAASISATLVPAMRVARISCCSLMPSHFAQYCIECQLRTSTAAVSRTLASDVNAGFGRDGRPRVQARIGLDAADCRSVTKKAWFIRQSTCKLRLARPPHRATDASGRGNPRRRPHEPAAAENAALRSSRRVSPLTIHRFRPPGREVFRSPR